MSEPDTPTGKQDAVTAIDILLDPDETMVAHAQAANARLLTAYPAGFALDAAHQPHITVLQRFVNTAALDEVVTAAETVLVSENPADWRLRAVKHYYIPAPPIGLAGIVVEPTADLLRLQQRLIDAIAPYTVLTGTVAAFASTQDGRDIQEELIEYVTNFVEDSSGDKFNPHVTTGQPPLPIWTRCSRSRSRHLCSVHREPPFISSAPLALPKRNSRRCR